MITIWKYPIEITDEQTIKMPMGARILTVQMQGPQCCIWALVDPSKPMAERHIRTHGTGHEIPLGITTWAYIGTIQSHGGALIFHVFAK